MFNNLVNVDHCDMEMHIGKLIKERLQETGMKKSEFARRINKTSQNIYDIFERKSIDTGLLMTISEILRYDFFEPLSNHLDIENTNTNELKEMQAKFGSTVGMFTALNKCMSENQQQLLEIKHLKKEVEYLKEINSLLKKPKV